DGVGGATDQEGHGQARHGGQDRTGDDRQVQRVQLAREPGDAQQGGHPSTVDERPRPTPHGATLRNVRSRRLLVTTKTLEKAIAAPASIGFSSARAATGIAAALEAKAQNRLPLMVPRVRRDSRIASTAASRSPRTRVRSAASIATSVPVP